MSSRRPVGRDRTGDQQTKEEEETILLDDAEDDARDSAGKHGREEDAETIVDETDQGGEFANLKALEKNLRLNELRLAAARLGFELFALRHHAVDMFAIVEICMLAMVLMSIVAPNSMPWSIPASGNFFTTPTMLGLIPVWLVWPMVIIQAQPFVHPRSPYIPVVFGYTLLAMLFLILEMVLVIIQNVNVWGNNNALATLDIRTAVGLIVSLVAVVLAAVVYVLLGLLDEISLLIMYGPISLL
jgi:hypothetical protein